jgi:hypothetical protein
VSAPGTAPTFLVIGAQKCGTTWLAEVLRDHPDVFVVPEKELHYYDDHTRHTRGLDWYLPHFAAGAGATAIGEATPNYLWTRATPHERARHHVSTDIPEKVHADFPDLKLLVCLRDPVDRAVSAYHHSIHARYVAPSTRILDAAPTFGIESAGRYAASLRDWFACWPRDRFHVLVYEDDIRTDAKRATVDAVCAFLGVGALDDDAALEGVYNARPGSSYLRLHHRWPLVARTLRRAVPAFERLDRHPITVTDAERTELRRRFVDDVLDLEELLGRDLSSWATRRTAG